MSPNKQRNDFHGAFDSLNDRMNVNEGMNGHLNDLQLYLFHCRSCWNSVEEILLVLQASCSSLSRRSLLALNMQVQLRMYCSDMLIAFAMYFPSNLKQQL